MNLGLRRWLSTPWIGSLVCTGVFFAIFWGFLHPGYAINDDLKIISIAAGYPANNPAPFLIFSNVILGIVLVPLYSLHTAVNWEIWIFSALNFLSVCALLYILLSSGMPTWKQVLGVSLILAGTVYFALNITFTSTAALACFAGICLILNAAQSPAGHHTMQFTGGIALILLGSLVRIEMLALVLPAFLPSVIFLFRSIRLKSLILASAIAGMAVFAGYAFDRLYVRANADWHSYYVYNKAAQMLQDAHRLENTGRQIRTIGWSGNDQELFARSFFPDANIYSIDRIRYLDEHVHGESQNAVYAVTSFLARLGSLRSVLLLLTMVAVGLWSRIGESTKGTVWALIAITIVCLGENMSLVWVYKDPDYVLFSSLAITAVLEVLMLNWMNAATPYQSPTSENRTLGRISTYGFMLMTVVVMAIAAVESVATSSDNQQKQTAYQSILADIRQLQSDGKIAKNPLIISPSHGLPWEWSNPFVLGFPGVRFLDTGWITFSPFYEGALQNFGIQSVPDALYQHDNVYLMTKSIFKQFLSRYFEEHENISVDYQTIYEMPNTYHIPLYDGVELYKVVRTK